MRFILALSVLALSGAGLMVGGPALASAGMAQAGAGGPDVGARLAAADAANAQAEAAWNRADWDEAARLYGLALAADRKAAGFASSRAAVDAVNLGQALLFAGRAEAAGPVLDQAIVERTRDSAGGGVELADLWRVRAQSLIQDPQRAEPAWRRAHDLYHAAGALARVVESAGQLAETLGRLNRPAEGIRLAEEAVGVSDRLGDPRIRGDALIWRGRARGVAGDAVGAEADIRAGLALQVDPQPFAHDSLAEVLSRQGRFAEAADAYTRAVAGWDAMGPPARSAMAGSVAQIGWARLEQDRLAEAESLFRQAVAVAAEAGDPNQAAFANAGLGWCLHLQERYGEAEPLLRQAVVDIARIEGVETRNQGAAVTNLAGDLQAQGRHAEALVEFRRAYDLYARTVGPDHPDIGWTLNAMARSAAIEAPPSADALFREGLEKAALLTPGHPEASERAGDYSRYLIGQGRAGDALVLLRAARQDALNRPGAARDPGAVRRSTRVRPLFQLQVEAAWLNAGG